MKTKDIFIKIGKILIVVFACVGVLLSGILAVGAIKNAIEKDDEQVEVLAYGDYNPIKRTIGYTNENVYLFSASVVFSTQVVKYLYVMNENFFNNPSVNDSFVYNIYEQPFAEIGYWDDLVLSNNIYIYNNPFKFNALKYKCTMITSFGYNNSHSVLLKMYEVYAYNTSASVEMKIATFCYMTENPQPTQNSFGFIANPEVVYKDYILRVDANTNPMLYNLLITDDNATGLVDYSLGYQNGYSEGHSVGYNEGYDIGSTGLTNNPFNLISNAFSALASILNIQILPNLPLGVLIFTPLIVIIIIAVVKIFRG